MELDRDFDAESKSVIHFALTWKFEEEYDL